MRAINDKDSVSTANEREAERWQQQQQSWKKQTEGREDFLGLFFLCSKLQKKKSKQRLDVPHSDDTKESTAGLS